MRCALIFTLALAATGCGGGSRPAADVERGRAAVTAALDSWKANEPAAKLKSRSDPIDFPEELRTTHSLVSYTLGKVDSTDPQVIRYTVALTLKDKKGKTSDREVTYSVALGPPVVVARDPYY